MGAKPPSWWDAEARKYHLRTCPKCGNLCTRGIYIPPHMIQDNRPRECGVIENCLLCGWETVHIWGVGGEPYTWNERQTGKGRTGYGV